MVLSYRRMFFLLWEQERGNETWSEHLFQMDEHNLNPLDGGDHYAPQLQRFNTGPV